MMKILAPADSAVMFFDNSDLSLIRPPAPSRVPEPNSRKGVTMTSLCHCELLFSLPGTPLARKEVNIFAIMDYRREA
jgi:hypothetical protein